MEQFDMKGRFLYYYLPLVLYMVFIFVASIRPMPEELPELWQMDKVFHLGAYFILGAMVARALAAEGMGARKIVLYGFFVSLGYGLFTEFCQIFTVYRNFDLIDLAADGAGGLAGAALYSRFFAYRKETSRGGVTRLFDREDSRE